jgi:5-formyltetrahydrofolate cyclo-ligase
VATGEFSSPACFLHEVEAGLADAPAPSNDWADVRLWRKAKRQVLIERRVAMSASDRAAAQKRITERLTIILMETPPRLLGFYWPFKGEYDPRPLVRTLHKAGVSLALPVVVGKAQPLIFRPWWPRAPMALGVWNIPYPTDGEPVEPDILLVPLVGFDRGGYRLGYGGGFYDRTLAAAQSRPKTIGIGFTSSRLRTIYPQPHDIPMDQIVADTVA